MVKDAELQAAADQSKKDEAEVRNQASSLIYSTEKSLKEVGDKLDAGARGDVEAALAELKRVSDNGTSAEVKTATEKLQEASYKMAELLYKATGTEGAAPNGAASGGASENGASQEQAPPPEDVIDAEFKEAK
jgi:molecular chaperone DnaK